MDTACCQMGPPQTPRATLQTPDSADSYIFGLVTSLFVYSRTLHSQVTGIRHIGDSCLHAINASASLHSEPFLKCTLHCFYVYTLLPFTVDVN